MRVRRLGYGLLNGCESVLAHLNARLKMAQPGFRLSTSSLRTMVGYASRTCQALKNCRIESVCADLTAVAGQRILGVHCATPPISGTPDAWLNRRRWERRDGVNYRAPITASADVLTASTNTRPVRHANLCCKHVPMRSPD